MLRLLSKQRSVYWVFRIGLLMLSILFFPVVSVGSKEPPIRGMVKHLTGPHSLKPEFVSEAFVAKVPAEPLNLVMTTVHLSEMENSPITVTVNLTQQSSAAQTTRIDWNPTAYYGIQHRTEGKMESFLIDPKDPHVRFETVLARGKSGECRDVNLPQFSWGPGCVDQNGSYPAELVGDMVNQDKYSGAVLAFNGDLFGSRDNGHGPEGFTVKNGERFDGVRFGDCDSLFPPQRDENGRCNPPGNDLKRPSIAFSRYDGQVEISRKRLEDLENPDLYKDRFYNAVGGFPILVDAGGSVVNHECQEFPQTCLDMRASENTARTAIGKRRDGKLIVIVTPEGSGLTFTELAEKMLALDVVEAINLDGGGSSQLWYAGNSGNDKYLVKSGRHVSEALFIFSSPIEPPLDQIVIPADGTLVQSNINLESNVTYSIVITGTYRYDMGEPGEFADAQYRENDNDQWTIRWNSVEFNGTRLTANTLDLTNHTYTFYVTGQGQHMSFRIYDQPGTYGDNEGSLTATISAITSYSISGQVTDKKGKSISGVTISANSSFNTTTGENGTYSLSGLPSGNYTVVPSKSNYSFTPPSLPVSVPPNTSTVNFTGTPNCPVIAALNPVNSDANRHSLGVADLISLYHQFRDDILSPSAKGKEYIKDFEEQGSELSEILLTNSELQTRTAQFLGNAAPAFGSLLPTATEDVVLSQTLYNEANVLVHDLANAGSQELHNKMLQIWLELALDKQIGKTTTEIWKQIQQSKVYLPLASRQNPPPVIPFEINLSTNSRKQYQIRRSEAGNGLTVGSLVYTDRDYTYATIPTFLRGATYILTANDDAEKNGLAVNINVNRATQIYVAHSDQSATKPAWLNPFQDTGENLTFIDRNGRVVILSVFKAVFPAGEILLGENAPPSGGNHSMYTVVIR